MEHIDFVQRVDAYAQAAAKEPAAFGRHVFGMALLAGLWIWGGLLLGLVLLAWSVLSYVYLGFHGLQIFGFFAGLALLLSVLRLTRSDWVAPDGIAVPPTECPRLFEALERVRQKVGGPRIAQLVVTEDYGLRIAQQMRLGGLLPARHHLLLGLPLAMAIDRPRLVAMLAQEYSHLRRRQGWLQAAVFRARRRLQGLHDRLADARQMTHLGWANERFMRWYLPRWWAASFVMARQDEAVADRMAARWVSKPLMGEALSEVAVRGRWFREQFWTMHWLRARELASPMGPFSLMAGVMNHSMDVNWVYQGWKQEYYAPASYQDTPPGLRERLKGLDVPPGLTPMSSSNCLAWLGKRSERWIELLDQRWCLRHGHDWVAYRQILSVSAARVAALMPREPYLDADQLVELGWQLQSTAWQHQDAPLPIYQRALELEPGNARALAACASLHMGMDGEAQLQYLAQAFVQLSAMGAAWCRLASGVLDVLEDEDVHEASVRQWREDWRAREALARAQLQALRQEQLEQGSLLGARACTALAHPLWASELAVLQLHLQHCPRLRRAWLMARPLRALPGAYALVLVLDRPGVHYQDNKRLEQQWRGYLERELLLCKLMPLWLTHVDELGPTGLRQLAAMPWALLYDRSVQPAAARSAGAPLSS
ncbi:MAG: M48 family metallopeptidase [Comamonas sp.]